MSRLLILCLLAANTCAYATHTPPSFSSSPFLPPLSFLADTIFPTIQCPPSDTLTAGPGVCGAMFNYTVTANDDQPTFILIQLSGLASGSEFPIGVTVNSFLVTDLAGNTATCSFSVTVEADSYALFCQDLAEIELGPNCDTQLEAEDLLEPGIYGCVDNYVVQLDKVPPFGNGPWVPGVVGQADAGKTYTYRVRDPYTGNVCWGSLTVVDPPPLIDCSDFNVHCAVDNLSPVFLRDSLGIAAAMPTIADNCPGVMISFSDLAQNLPCDTAHNISGTVTRIWTVTDANGSTTTCQQTIYRQRTFIGVQFPPNTTASCGDESNIGLTGTPFIKVGNKGFPLWPSSYCELEANFYDTLFVQYCGGGGQFVRTWKVFDLCRPVSQDNPLIGLQIIDFVDNTGPTIHCDSSLVVSVNAVDCSGDVDLPDLSLEDDCSNTMSIAAFWSANNSNDTLPGTLIGPDTLGVFGIATDLPVGTTLVTYLAEDICGNTSTCQTSVTLWDMEPPTANCTAFFTVFMSPSGQVALGADTLDVDSQDSCSQQLDFKIRRTAANECQPNDLFYDEVLFCCTDIGDTVALTRRVYDIALPDGPLPPDFAAGQFSECTVLVEVLDTLPPACTAPPNVAVACNDLDPTLTTYGTASTNCAADSLALTVNYAQFDTACLSGTIVRTFQVFDKNGNSGACSQQIVVNHVQDYYLKFPNDTIVLMCDSLGAYGEPKVLSNGCELFGVTFTDEVFTIVPDACRKIERTWTIVNWCTYDPNETLVNVPNPNPNAITNHPNNFPGPVVSPAGTLAPWSPTLTKINPSDPTETDFSIFWNANANGYLYEQIIKIIDTQDPIVSNCPVGPAIFNDSTSNDPLLWNQVYWWDMVIGSQDMAEGSSPLSITASDACSGSGLSVSYLLYLDLDGDNVRETVINSNNAPAPGTVNFGNASNPSFTGGTPRVFDGRPVPPNDIYRWALHQSVDGNKRTTSVQWKTQAQMPTQNNPFGSPGIEPLLPYGTHRIRWAISDECGNEAQCDYIFTVKDGQPPTIQCATDTLNIEMPPNNFTPLSVLSFLLDAHDNYTPPTTSQPSPNLIKFAVRKAGSGSGFPLDGNGQPQDTVIFNCTELGNHLLEIWARDLSGNASYCEASLTLTDVDSSCNATPLTIAGNLQTELDSAVVNADVTLSATSSMAPPISLNTISGQQGDFEFVENLPISYSYTLTPAKDGDDLNGVSTFDLLQITKHILGLEPLNSPYKIIAADANRSSSVTTFDIVEIRKLILGIYDEFPNNTSWRFVDKDFVFPNPFNPFLTQFPETIVRSNVTMEQLEEDFVGIKVGDVNNTAVSDSFFVPNGRSAGTLFFHVDDRAVQRDEVFDVHFKTSEQTLGWQFTLHFNGLEIVEVSPGKDLTADHFGIFKDALTASVENGADHFAVTFRATKPGQLSEMLGISSRITRAEAYRNDENDAMTTMTLDIALLFDNRLISKVGFELYQNQPNPFRGATSIGFHLPENTEATLTIFDETGRVLLAKSSQYPRGYHSVSIEQRLLNGAGVLYYKLETPTDSAVRKMVMLR